MEGAVVDKTACFVDDEEGKDNPIEMLKHAVV